MGSGDPFLIGEKLLLKKTGLQSPDIGEDDLPKKCFLHELLWEKINGFAELHYDVDLTWRSRGWFSVLLLDALPM